MTDASEETTSGTDTIEDGIVQLRFADELNSIHAINAAEVAEVLQGLVEFTSDMAKHGLFGDGMPPEVRVRPIKEGSFVLEAVLKWASDNPELAVAISTTAGGFITKALDTGIKKLRGTKVTDFDYLDSGNVKVKWADGDVVEIPATVWVELNTMKRRTRKALQKIMAPLSDEADRLEVRDASVNADTDAVLREAPQTVATRADYREAIAEPDDVVEEVNTFTTEATLKSIDFRPGEKWRVSTPHGTRLATIDDDEFLRGLDAGAPLHKGDVFEVTIREVSTTTNSRTTKDWSIISARRTKRGTDDGDAGASRSSES